MARKDQNTAESTEDKAAAAREAIATRPRQSQKRLVEYGAIISTLAPERFDDIFGDSAGAIAEVLDQVENPVIKFRQKSDEAQLALAIRALENTDPQNGYANFAFDAEAFAEKTRVKTPRTKASKVEKAKSLLDGATPEELAELAALLGARGVDVPAAE